MSILKITNLHKKFDKNIILNGIDLSCETGEIVGVFGRNGTGKSTLLKLMFGTLKADKINVKINGNDIRPKKIIPSKIIAYLPQDTFLPKNLKVRAVIPFFFPEGSKQDIVFYAPNVSSFENRKVGELFIGQLRYLELLIIGNLEHSFLLLDEPFAMVEPIYKKVIKDLLLDLKKEKGIVLTDHYYEDVLEITTKNYLLKDAKKIEVYSKDDLITHGYLKRNTL